MAYTVHGILQAGILEWVAVPFSRGSSQPRDQTQVSCIVGRFLTCWAMREAHKSSKYCLNIINLEVLSSESFISGLSETLDIICPGSELLSICRRVKLANISPALQTQWWSRITVPDISIPKVGKWKRGVTDAKQFWNPTGKNMLGFNTGNNTLWLSALTSEAPLSGLGLYPWSHPSFFQKGRVYLHLSIFTRLFATRRMFVCCSSFLLSSLVPFSLTWWCFCWCSVVSGKVLVSLPSISGGGLLPSDRTPLHSLFWMVLSLFLASAGVAKEICESRVWLLQRALRVTEHSDPLFCLRHRPKAV